MSKSNSISISDVIQALKVLDVQDDIACDVILNLLGFKQVHDIYDQVDKPFPKSEDTSIPSKSKKFEKDDEPEVSDNIPPNKDLKKTSVQPLQPIAFEEPGGPSEWLNITPIEKPGEIKRLNYLPYQALFVEHWTRYIVNACLATNALNGPMNIPQLVESIASRKPVKEIPRERWPSLYKGVQVLIDIGDGLVPFARDQKMILDKIYHIVGKESVSVLQFRNCPSKGLGSGPIWTWKPYRPPLAGTPVLIITDLGIGKTSSNYKYRRKDEWKSFTQILQKSFCPLILFVPYPPDRWPKWQIRGMNIIQWDRKTSIIDIQKIKGNLRKRKL